MIINNIKNNFVFLKNIYECCLSLQLHHNYEAMNINNLLSTFEQRLRLQRYNDASIRNYKSAVDSFLRLAARKYQKPEELDAGKIEKYVYWLIQKKAISSSYQRMVVASVDKFSLLSGKK